MIVRLFLLLFCLLLVGCDSILQEEDLTQPIISPEDDPLSWDVNRYYSEAKLAFSTGRYDDALAHHQSIVGLFSNTDYARQSLVDMVYINHFLKNWDQVKLLSKRFQKRFPNTKANAYVLYLTAVSLHEEFKHFFDDVLELEQSGRDRSTLLNVYFAFKKVVDRFGKSEYAQDARKQMLQIHDALASNEMKVAMFYAKRRVYLAVINRIKYLIEHFPTSKLRSDAIFLMAYYYNRLELTDLSDDAESVLRLNYPSYRPSEQIVDLIQDDIVYQTENIKTPTVFDQQLLGFLSQTVENQEDTDEVENSNTSVEFDVLDEDDEKLQTPSNEFDLDQLVF